MNAADPISLPRRAARLAGSLLGWTALAVTGLWSVMAVYYSNLPAAWLRTVVAVVCAAALLAVLIWIRPNCTTLIRGHTKPYAPNPRFDWRFLLNGRVDQMAYERKSLDQSLPFAELKVRSRINERARSADRDSEFSTRIRESLPGMGGTPIARDRIDAARSWEEHPPFLAEDYGLRSGSALVSLNTLEPTFHAHQSSILSAAIATYPTLNSLTKSQDNTP